MFCICVKWLLPPGDNQIAVNKYYYYYYYIYLNWTGKGISTVKRVLAQLYKVLCDPVYVWEFFCIKLVSHCRNQSAVSDSSVWLCSVRRRYSNARHFTFVFTMFQQDVLLLLCSVDSGTPNIEPLHRYQVAAVRFDVDIPQSVTVSALRTALLLVSSCGYIGWFGNGQVPL
jgi:hypothetical protein